MNDSENTEEKALLNVENDLVIETDRDINNALQNMEMDLQISQEINIPIAQLSTLGAGVSSLIPALRTVTQTTTIDMGGLYRVANAKPGDALKLAKDGTNWGALETAGGASKMAKFQQASSVSATTTSVAAFNPATILMAAALLSIEKQLGNIQKTQEQILRIIKFDKESKIEGTAQQLLSLIKKYKYSWDNDKFIAASCDFVGTVQQSSRADIISLRKGIDHDLGGRQLVIVRTAVDTKATELISVC